MIEAEARKRSEAIVAKLQEQIILCERRLEEVNDRAEKTEERLVSFQVYVLAFAVIPLNIVYAFSSLFWMA